jgi:hypothetical protein
MVQAGSQMGMGAAEEYCFRCRFYLLGNLGTDLFRKYLIDSNQVKTEYDRKSFSIANGQGTGC